MIKFLFKLWELNRPYKARFLLGAFFGILNGFAQPMVIGTAVLVFSIVFSTPTALRAPKLGSAAFSTRQIVNLPALAGKLSHPTDPLSEYLSGQLDDQARKSLAVYESSPTNAEELKAVLAGNFNRIISVPVAAPALYDDARFRQVQLRPETVELRETKPEGEDLVRLNGLLLEDAYPSELAQNQSIAGRFQAWCPPWLLEDLRHLKSRLSASAAGSKIALILVVSLIPLVILLRGVISYLNSYLMCWVAIRTICDLRARLFEHLLNLPLSFFTASSTGELMSRTNDLAVLQNMIAVSLVTIIKEPISLLSYAAVLLAIDPRLTLVALVVFPFCIIPIATYSRKGRRASAAIQTETAALNKVMHESFTGNRIIKAYNLEERVARDFKHKLKNYITHFMRVVRATESPGPLIEFLGSIGVAGIFLWLAGRSTPVEFVYFVTTLLMMYSPVKNLTRLHSQMTQAQAATERFFELLDTPNHLTDPPQPVPLKAAGAEIHFDNVSFKYEEQMVLHNIQLKVQPGQMVALVGRTGSGKTTLTNLLLRFYDPTQGALRIGGTDLRGCAMRDLRSQIAVVTQETILFDDTVWNNIACGRPGATAAEVEAAARHAHAHEFIMEKPGGYQAQIGEKGVTLSGGQRQRISIARAILKNAPILILDEAFSSLDNERERMVQAALDELMVGRTTICIAHRLSTVQHADLIIVLDKGRIVETGRHAELMELGGIYHKLQTLQIHDDADGPAA